MGRFACKVEIGIENDKDFKVSKRVIDQVLSQTEIVYAWRIPPRRPRTLRTWLGSARNFGNTRFGRFGIFDFLKPKKIFEKKNRIFFFRKKFRFRVGFSSFSADFGGARFVLMSKSDSSRFFASDGRVLRLVRGLEATIND